RALGAGGDGAWLSLRVYDVTGRIFDGTNAHAYFDHRVERHDRQWFFAIGKPGSTACVEIGMKSSEGYFVRIARSARAALPRSGPVPPGEVEWLSVHATTGTIESSHTAPSPAVDRQTQWQSPSVPADPARTDGAAMNGAAENGAAPWHASPVGGG